MTRRPTARSAAGGPRAPLPHDTRASGESDGERERGDARATAFDCGGSGDSGGGGGGSDDGGGSGNGDAKTTTVFKLASDEKELAIGDDDGRSRDEGCTISLLISSSRFSIVHEPLCGRSSYGCTQWAATSSEKRKDPIVAEAAAACIAERAPHGEPWHHHQRASQGRPAGRERTLTRDVKGRPQATRAAHRRAPLIGRPTPAPRPWTPSRLAAASAGMGGRRGAK